jgi:hypothetical protein
MGLTKLDRGFWIALASDLEPVAVELEVADGVTSLVRHSFGGTPG